MKMMVALLSPAQDRACEAQLALVLADDLDQRLPDLNALMLRFAPNPARLPDVLVHLASLNSYDVLVDSIDGMQRPTVPLTLSGSSVGRVIE